MGQTVKTPLITQRPVLRLKRSRGWSQTDEALLKQMLLDGHSVGKIARQLKRTETAAKQRAVELKLSVSSDLRARAERNRKHLSDGG